MRKLWTFLREETVPQATGLVFLMMSVCATLVVLTNPLSLPEPARTLYYAMQDPIRNLEFIFGFAFAAAVLAGIVMCAVSFVNRKLQAQ